MKQQPYIQPNHSQITQIYTHMATRHLLRDAHGHQWTGRQVPAPTYRNTPPQGEQETWDIHHPVSRHLQFTGLSEEGTAARSSRNELKVSSGDKVGRERGAGGGEDRPRLRRVSGHRLAWVIPQEPDVRSGGRNSPVATTCRSHGTASQTGHAWRAPRLSSCTRTQLVEPQSLPRAPHSR